MLANKDRILEKMEEFKLDVIIASFPENVTYLADFLCHRPYLSRFFSSESFVLFPRRTDIAPALIIPTLDAAWIGRFPSWIEEVYTFGDPYYAIYPEGTLSKGEAEYKHILDNREKNDLSAGEAIVKALKQKGLDKARIGLDEKGVCSSTREHMVNALPNAKIFDVFELLRIIRMVKTPEELERLKTVGLLNERSVMSVVSKVSEGISEEELTQQFLESIAKEGAVFEFWSTGSGTQSSISSLSYGHFYPPSGYRLKKGDIFKFDGGSIYNKYYSDSGGMAILGIPSQRQKLCYRAIEAGMERAMELLRPGVLPSKIFQETVAAVEKAGLKDFSKYAFFVGHGIGIESRDYPILTPPVKAASPFFPGSYDLPVEENMVINIEVPYRELGLGAFQIEHTLLVNKGGCEKLYPHHRELFVR